MADATDLDSRKFASQALYCNHSLYWQAGALLRIPPRLADAGTPVPKTIPFMAFGTRVLTCGWHVPDPRKS